MSVFQPISASAKLYMNPHAEVELKTPKLDWSIEVQNIAIELTKPQVRCKGTLVVLNLGRFCLLWWFFCEICWFSLFVLWRFYFSSNLFLKKKFQAEEFFFIYLTLDVAESYQTIMNNIFIYLNFNVVFPFLVFNTRPSC